MRWAVLQGEGAGLRRCAREILGGSVLRDLSERWGSYEGRHGRFTIRGSREKPERRARSGTEPDRVQAYGALWKRRARRGPHDLQGSRREWQAGDDFAGPRAAHIRKGKRQVAAGVGRVDHDSERQLSSITVSRFFAYSFRFSSRSVQAYEEVGPS